MDKQECITRVMDKFHEMLDIVNQYDPNIDHISIFSVKGTELFYGWYDDADVKIIDHFKIAEG